MPGRRRVELPAQGRLGIVGRRRPGRHQRRDLLPILGLDGHVRVADMRHGKIAAGTLRRRDEREINVVVGMPARAEGVKKGPLRSVAIRHRDGDEAMGVRFDGQGVPAHAIGPDDRLAIGDRHTADPAAGSGVVDRAADGERHPVRILPPGAGSCSGSTPAPFR